MKISGWGRYPIVDCRTARLHDPRDLQGPLARRGTLIARGRGRSYGDAALNRDLTVSTLGLGRMQAFEADTGLLTCEAGVGLDDILRTFVPRGWFPPVVPGTKFVTVGGMIAADVHGKNHHRDGTFGAHVEALTLATADGGIRVCSRTQDADLFRATLGGMGLTGVILSASFRMQPIEASFVLAETVAARDLDETMSIFEASHDWPYSVAWIDCLARGPKLGRALVLRGAPMRRRALPGSLASRPLRTASEAVLPFPVDAPAFLLNRSSVGLFNGLYYHRGRAHGAARPVHFDPFFFPLDRIDGWNRLYGRRGFVQYQCVLPPAESPAGLAALLSRIAASGQGSFLAVLKRFGPAGEGLMSFPMEGYTLALDFPLRRGTLPLIETLDEITRACGGRVYLAKDACCRPERVREGYPGCAAFDAVRSEAAGAPRKFASELSVRLGL